VAITFGMKDLKQFFEASAYGCSKCDNIIGMMKIYHLPRDL